MPGESANDIIQYLRENAIVEKPTPLEQRICRDQDDDIILALAHQYQGAFIISGDNDLLILKEYKSIPIVSPRNFWEMLREGEYKPSP